MHKVLSILIIFMPADSNICKLKSHWPNFSMVVDGGFNYQAHSKIRKLNQEIKSIILMSFKLDGQHFNLEKLCIDIFLQLKTK